MASFAWAVWNGAMPLVFEILPFVGAFAIAFLIVCGALANYDDSDEPLD